MYQDELLAPWFEALRRSVPDLDIVDAHVHVGTTDPAGYQAEADEVIAALERVDGCGVVFPVANPAGYSEANDQVLALAAEVPERVVPFARIEPDHGGLGEAERCVQGGAAGLKLHPRGDGFELDDPRLDSMFAFADERRLPVMVHAGVGHRSVGPDAVARARVYPGVGLILAHAAVGAFEDVVPRLSDVPNLFVDTSWWNVSDLWAVFRLAPWTQIVHGSDVPFNSPTQGALMSGRLAIQAGTRMRR